MPQVPYNPVPSERPSGQGIPARHIDAPIGAFGGGVAEATQGLGGQIEKSNDQLWNTAFDLQKLKLDSEAKEADAQYVITAGKLHADYGALSGKEAVDAYPKYMADLKEAREKIRDGLSSDYARKLYDGPSLSTFGRTIFNGAGHAATENKKYALGASQARIAAAGEQAFEQPGDDIAFTKATRMVEAETRDKAALNGWSPEQTDLAAKANVSTLLSKRITGLSRTAPFEAAKMLEENREKMLETDFLKVDNAVRGQSRAVGSVNIANEVFAAGQETEAIYSKDDDGRNTVIFGRPAKTLAQMEDEVRKKAAAIDPKDPLLATHAISALRGQYNQSQYAKRQEQVTNLQTVSEAIQTGGVTNIQQLRADPKVAAAIDALPPKQREGIPNQINRYNAAANKVSNEQSYQRLYGLSNNNVEEFLNTDLTAEQLSQQDMRKLQEVQRKLKDLPNADPRVNRAMSQIRGALGSQLESLGVYRRTDGNKEDYDKLTGALQGALDVWQETHGKPASYKEIAETIGPQLIRKITEPGWLWGTNKVDFFKQTVPEEFIKARKEHATANEQPEPTPEQMQKEFIRMKFMGLYGKKKE